MSAASSFVKPKSAAEKDLEENGNVYMVIVPHSPPLRFFSAVNLVVEWRKQVEERNKTGEWWRPLEFRETNEPGAPVIGMFATNGIIAILQGMPVTRKQFHNEAGVPSVP